MKAVYVVLVLVLLTFFPHTSNAALLINEVAWMGTTVGPNEEWIELYNDGGDAVIVDGWTLSDNVSLEIPLTGTINAGEYAVLERTDDETVSGTAFLIYTGALSNDGRTLTLRRSDASIEDQVAGGEGWSNIGGDNTTKNTAQRTQSGWITGIPTPGETNTSVSVPPSETNNENENTNEENTNTNENTSPVTTSKSKSGSGSKKVTLVPEKKEFTLDIKGPAIAYVNQEVSFEVVPSGLGETIMNSLVYAWSFGDSYAGGGKKVTHTFAYPGEYVVIVDGEFAKNKTFTRHEITVLPVTFSLTRTETGNIQIHNNAKYEIDLSGFTLRGTSDVVIPNHTLLLPNSTITIHRNRFENGVAQNVALYDTQNIVVAAVVSGTQTMNQNLATQASPQKVVMSGITQKKAEVALVEEMKPEVLGTTTTLESTTTDAIIPIGKQEERGSGEETALVSTSKLPQYGLLGIIALGILALYTRRSKSLT